MMYHGYGFTYVLAAQFLFFAFTIGLVIWIIRNQRNNKSGKAILDERLAAGEISKKEYSSTLKLLQGVNNE